jgi:hypothetical protein
LVYEDARTREWAGQVRQKLQDAAGDDAAHCTEWDLGDFRDPEVFRESAATLAQADAIVLAICEDVRLPAQFYLWVNSWLQQRDGLPGALIALVGTSGEPGPAFIEIRSYLHAVAGQGRMELLLKRCDLSSEPATDPDLLGWARARGGILSSAI